MSLFSLLFGRRPVVKKSVRANGIAVVESPPPEAELHAVKAKAAPDMVRAHLAKRDGGVRTSHGQLSYRAGQHYIVTSNDGAVSVVRRDIFEKTYEKRWFGRYAKRPGIVYRYFTLPHPAMVGTLEGPQRAEPGDWIMQGVAGELWPVKPTEAEAKYEPVSEPVDAHAPEPAHA